MRGVARKLVRRQWEVKWKERCFQTGEGDREKKAGCGQKGSAMMRKSPGRIGKQYGGRELELWGDTKRESKYLLEGGGGRK